MIFDQRQTLLVRRLFNDIRTFLSQESWKGDTRRQALSGKNFRTINPKSHNFTKDQPDFTCGLAIWSHL